MPFNYNRFHEHLLTALTTLPPTPPLAQQQTHLTQLTRTLGQLTTSTCQHGRTPTHLSLALTLQLLFEIAIARRLATTLWMRAEDAEQRRAEGGAGEYAWWGAMGRLWVELAVEECVNLESWVEGLSGVVGRVERREEGVVDGRGERGGGEGEVKGEKGGEERRG